MLFPHWQQVGQQYALANDPASMWAMPASPSAEPGLAPVTPLLACSATVYEISRQVGHGNRP